MSTLYLQHFRFHLEPKAALRMPAHNKGSTWAHPGGQRDSRWVWQHVSADRASCELPGAGDLRAGQPVSVYRREGTSLFIGRTKSTRRKTDNVGDDTPNHGKPDSTVQEPCTADRLSDFALSWAAISIVALRI
jgi:hypothetical protein